jgi:putative nucleotidyltransferase with HDIG domain
VARFPRERRLRLCARDGADLGAALALAQLVEADDEYTGAHCRGVAGLALAVADRMGLDGEQRRRLEFAALLHDVGKTAIPKGLIDKPCGLDPSEWNVVKTHTLEGQRMVERFGGGMRHVGRIVRSHHERWDGTGYPDGLAGTAIPLEARIVAACDTWNAMRTDRVYRDALPLSDALAELGRSAGSQLDPEIVSVVIAIVACEEERIAVVEPVGKRARLRFARPFGGGRPRLVAA